MTIQDCFVYLLCLGAVQLAFAAALLNIQIPLMLGDLVNVVARYMREHPGRYLKEVKEPALKLLAYYGLQVSCCLALKLKRRNAMQRFV